MRTLPIDRPTLDDPLYSQKNPHQTFLLILSVVASWPLLQGKANSAALERELDNQAVILWGVCLLAGSVLALVGEFWRGHDWTGLVIERGGLLLVGAAACIYAFIVWTTADNHQSDVSFAAAITLAYGTSCLWRVAQIVRRLRWLAGIRAEYDRQYAHDVDQAYQEDEDRNRG